MSAILPVIGLVVLMVLQISKNQRYVYQCDECGEKISLSVWAGALAPHSMGKKWVKCPKCGRMGWATPVPK